MGNIEDWKYYKSAIVSALDPHKLPDLSPVNDNSIWKAFDKKAYFVRWTDNYDCKIETNWWFIIKDSPFDINQLKAKRRYVINNGIKNFDVRVIDDAEKYAEEFFTVAKDAYLDYPKEYRPEINHDKFVNGVHSWAKYDVLAAFDRENQKLSGYVCLKRGTESINFQMQRVLRSAEKRNVNAALVYGILEFYHDDLEKGCYIYDGERSVLHETAFQDYLEKYFDFRKAYCRLNIKYKKNIAVMVKVLYPMRGILRKFNKIGMINKINAILRMEEIIRNE